jgi:nucleotide-binding universal stress UspA family protein
MATDFSLVAERALLYAEMIAHQYHSTVHLVHVLPTRTDGFLRSNDTNDTVESFDTNMRDARNLLRRTTDRFQGTEHETWLEMGDIAERVLAVCNHVDADLVVVGTQSVAGFAKLFFGSTAEKIFRSAGCPVLTVGTHVDTKPGARLKEVLCPTDFLPESEQALPYAVSIAQANAARLTLLHVVRGNKPRSLNFSPLDGFKSDFERLLRKTSAPVSNVRFALEFNGAVADAVRDYSAKMDHCLIVLGVREAPSWATYLPDTAQKIATLASSPVLTIRNEYH